MSQAYANLTIISLIIMMNAAALFSFPSMHLLLPVVNIQYSYVVISFIILHGSKLFYYYKLHFYFYTIHLLQKYVHLFST